MRRTVRGAERLSERLCARTESHSGNSDRVRDVCRRWGLPEKDEAFLKSHVTELVDSAILPQETPPVCVAKEFIAATACDR